MPCSLSTPCHSPLSPLSDASPTGEDRGSKSLLGSSDPTIWFVALDAMPPLMAPFSAPPAEAGAEADLDLVETLRQVRQRQDKHPAAVLHPLP